MQEEELFFLRLNEKAKWIPPLSLSECPQDKTGLAHLQYAGWTEDPGR